FSILCFNLRFCFKLLFNVWFLCFWTREESSCWFPAVTLSPSVSAPSCFLAPEPSREEAAVSAWRPLMHPEGDHMSLINVYNAFLQHNEDEAWCAASFLSHAALRLAAVIRAELLEVMQRIELPVSPPAFGCQDNCTNIKRALISGFFLKVAHDVDGSGNYLLLTHRHVAHLHPASSYRCRQPRPSPPSWVLYHEFTISRDNCIRIASEGPFQLNSPSRRSRIPTSEDKWKAVIETLTPPC
uniref:DEAQ box RNA-dependent ATPase 1 n=1 Tax=Fundulus heteroclitus TaxID=8078 RepID=A0A3Q2P2K3_FUNHE